MYIIDKNGKQIAIKGIEGAIKMAEIFLDLHRENPAPDELDKKLFECWTRIYEKLLRLQKAQKDNLLTYKKQDHETD